MSSRRPILPFPLLMAGLLLLAVGLRLRNLVTRPLWFDEAMEYWVATTPLPELLTAVKTTLQDPPLYSLLLHGWLQAGDDEFWLRFLSLCISLLSVATLYALGCRLHSRPVGLVAAFCLALLPPDIRFAQEVGQYALLVWLLLLNLLFLTRAWQQNQKRDWTGWLVTAVLSAFNFYGALLPLLAVSGSTAVMLALRRDRSRLRRCLAVLALFIICLLPLLFTWLPDQLLRGPTSQAFQLTPAPWGEELAAIGRNSRDLLIYQLTGYIPKPSTAVWLRAAALSLIIVSLWLGLRRAPRPLLVWLGAVWGVYLVAGRLNAYPYAGSRHALILTPLLLLVIAVGVVSLAQKRRLAGGLLLAGLTAVMLLAPLEPAEDIRTVTTAWLDQQETATPTYVYYNAVPAFAYQLRQQAPALSLPDGIWYWDCLAAIPNPICQSESITYGPWIRHLPAAEKKEAILAALPPHDQFWIIFSHTAVSEQTELMQTLLQDYLIAAEIEAEGAAAYLLQTTP